MVINYRENEGENFMNKENRKFFKVKQMLPNLYEISCNFVQCHLLVGNHHALLIDTSYGLVNLKEMISEITDLPLYIVNSHGHADHACGNSSFHQSIYIHPEDIHVFEYHNSSECRDIMFATLQKIQRILFFKSILPKKIKKESYLKNEFNDFIHIREGYVFDLGGKLVNVIELPGHTPGSIGFLCPDLRVLITSDAINKNVYMFLSESTKLSVYLNTLYKARNLDFDYFVTGHESKLYPKKEIDKYISLVENLDYSKGIPQKEFALTPGKEIRRCVLPNNFKRDIGIMISEDKLK